MEYSILSPGAKNPLPFSGLWMDQTTRYPLRWKARPAYTSTSNKPADELFTPASSLNVGDAAIFSAPLAGVDDLSSIRITIHKKDEKPGPSRLPSNEYPLQPSGTDASLYTDDQLSETIG